MSPEHISVDIQKFEFNLGSNWKNSVTRSIEIWQPNFGYFQYWLVKIYDIDNDTEISYKIVGNLESDPESGSISIDTPIAKTLVGKFVGDEISIETPSGILNYEILDVKHK